MMTMGPLALVQPKAATSTATWYSAYREMWEQIEKDAKEALKRRGI